MLARLKAEFSRYFFMTAPANSYAKTFYETFGIYSKSRNVVSEIIDGRLYLTSMPLISPLKKATQIQVPEQAGAILVISSIDIAELATSPLLLEPDAPKIKYHVLAMQDATALVGSIDQVFETLHLMSAFADNKYPIIIHCYSGVGRSAMITALHIAHRYLLGDAMIKGLIDEKEKLDVNSSNYIKDLYKVVSKLVLSRRDCCQFDAEIRNDFAAKVLTELNTRILAGKRDLEARDTDYQFLASFVQTRECKVLQHYFYHSMQTHYSYVKGIVPSITAQLGASLPVAEIIDPKKFLQNFFEGFLSNEAGWYQQLLDTVRNERSDSLAPNLLEQFCNASDGTATEEKQQLQRTERREMLNGILNVMIQLAIQFPNAAYSQQVLASLKLEAVNEKLLSLK